jgi:hypothetical protein
LCLALVEGIGDLKAMSIYYFTWAHKANLVGFCLYFVNCLYFVLVLEAALSFDFLSISPDSGRRRFLLLGVSFPGRHAYVLSGRPK